MTWAHCAALLRLSFRQPQLLHIEGSTHGPALLLTRDLTCYLLATCHDAVTAAIAREWIWAKKMDRHAHAKKQGHCGE